MRDTIIDRECGTSPRAIRFGHDCAHKLCDWPLELLEARIERGDR